jgi:hypothetical protein
LKPKAAAPTETAAEATTEKPKNRFSRPSSSFASRNTGSRVTKTTAAPEEVKEVAEKKETQAPSKLGTKPRNRFSLRNNAGPSTTEKSTESESTTASRLVKPRPQFSLRGRGNSRQASPTTEPSDATAEEPTENKEEKPAEKATSIVPRPTSRLNLNRPSNRLLPGQKPRTSPLNPRRGNDETNDSNKSANENESEAETTTQTNVNKLKSRPRIQVSADAKAKKTASPVAVNRKVNPLISKRKFGVTSTTGDYMVLHRLN